jgi:plasmid stabilization system protein ParE
MKIQFLESSAPGIRWMRRYFREQPQLNAKAASESYKIAKNLLKQEPYIGHVFDEIEGVFEKEISKTHFSIIYAVKDETVYIIDIRDQRGLRSSNAVRQYSQHLKKKYDL